MPIPSASLANTRIPKSGYNYYGHRFYNPDFAQWLNRDPIGEFGGHNVYGFVYNGPLDLFDPDGRAPRKDHH